MIKLITYFLVLIMRCQIINKTNNYVCKNKSLFISNNKRYCRFHYNYYMKDYVIIIQKYYKAYKNRKLINNIYLKLPDDLQRKIVFHIRQDYYYKKYKECIQNIICNRLKKSRNELTKYYTYNYGDSQLLIYLSIDENRINLLKNINLLKKYINLFQFTYNSWKCDYNFIKDILNTKLVVFEGYISNAEQNHIFEIVVW